MENVMENARRCLVAVLTRCTNSWPVTEEQRARRPGVKASARDCDASLLLSFLLSSKSLTTVLLVGACSLPF